MTGRGAVCFISNFSYLGGPSFVVARQRYLSEFDSLWFDCMNGDSRETGKLTPDGKPDPSVFSTEYNREGIRVGTAIGLMVRRAQRSPRPAVRFRHFWGVNKRADLLASLKATDFEAQYQRVSPTESNRFSFRPAKVNPQYLSWPKPVELCSISPFNGPVERRALALISITKADLVYRMKAYFNAAISDEAVKQIYPSLMMTGNRIVGPKARKKILGKFQYEEGRIVRYPFKPFDARWCYLENLRPLFSEPSPQLIAHRFPGNAFLVTRDTADKDPEGPPFYFSSLVCDYDCISGHARHFPIRTHPAPVIETSEAQASFLPAGTAPTANLSPAARAYLAALGIPAPDAEAEVAPGLQPYELIWLHALAIGYSPAYLRENADGIRQDWPRIPLPATLDALLASAVLGRQVAALLDTETLAPGVTVGTIRPELRLIAVLARVGGGALKPGTDDLAITAGWGHAGEEGVTMPGRGKLVKRPSASGGPTTYDVYLNDVAYWRSIPPEVWDYTIGGYQVIKKWLSYRERDLLGRPLTAEEAIEVTYIARRIAALILLQPALDANYQAVQASPYAWSKG